MLIKYSQYWGIVRNKETSAMVPAILWEGLGGSSETKALIPHLELCSDRGQESGRAGELMIATPGRSMLGKGLVCLQE